MTAPYGALPAHRRRLPTAPAAACTSAGSGTSNSAPTIAKSTPSARARRRLPSPRRPRLRRVRQSSIAANGPQADYQNWQYATHAATALRQLDEEYATWITGARALSATELDRPCGPAEGPSAQYALSKLSLHINREAIHHGAEIACLRDLYLHNHLHDRKD
ncbi:DinB family protein [Mycobacterium kansasii]|uniref:DinB family protein n=1 Tax=Mycobacterium kansasii TaxID=1768 RepID=UPI00352D1AC3